jgi:hypothetical protein
MKSASDTQGIAAGESDSLSFRNQIPCEKRIESKTITQQFNQGLDHSNSESRLLNRLQEKARTGQRRQKKVDAGQDYWSNFSAALAKYEGYSSEYHW